MFSLVGCEKERTGDDASFALTVSPTTASAGVNEFVEVMVTQTATDPSTLTGSFQLQITSSDDDVVGVPLAPSIQFPDSGTRLEEVTATPESDLDRKTTVDFTVDGDPTTLTQTIRFLCKQNGTARIEIEAANRLRPELTVVYFDFNRRQVTINCGTSSSADAGVTDGGSVQYGDPEIANPCTALPNADIAVLVGHPVISTQHLNTANRQGCLVNPVGGGAGMRFQMEVGINSNSANLQEAWRMNHDNPSETRPMTWSPDGELRVWNGTASVWAIIRNDDPIGRDIYVTVEGIPTQGDMMGMEAPLSTIVSTTEQASEDIHDYILSIQTIIDD